jgi:hypothetical protein
VRELFLLAQPNEVGEQLLERLAFARPPVH